MTLLSLKKNKLHQKLFWLLILLLPIQLGKHFWPESSYVLGLRVDYLSPTLYLTDLLVLGILVSRFWEKRRTKFNPVKNLKSCWWVVGFFLFLLVSSFLAQNPSVALLKLARLLLLSLLGFYVAKTKPSLKEIRLPLSLGIIYSDLLAIGQFFNQASFNGLFYWLGERSFSLSTPGIAKTSLLGQLFLRPYATFPHPNVLGGFLLVSLILINESKLKLTKEKIIGYLALALGVIGLFLSFSRSVWLTAMASAFWLNLAYLKKRKASKKIFSLSLIAWVLILFFLTALVFNLPFNEAFAQRLKLAEISIEMIRDYPLSGVGLNNFIIHLPNYWGNPGLTYWLQPVHNLFLLVLTETGLIGFAFFVWLLILTFQRLFKKRIPLPLLVALIAVLTLGLFDHYWLTLQQGQLLFTLVLGLSWAKRS